MRVTARPPGAQAERDPRLCPGRGCGAQGLPSLPSSGLGTRSGSAPPPARCSPSPLPGETHTHTPTGVHTHLGAHGRSPFTQSHRGLQFWGAHPSALPWGAAGPSPCPFVSSPLGAVCVPVGVLGCIYACVCMTRVTPQPARSRTGVRCPYPPQKQTSLGSGLAASWSVKPAPG